MVGWLIVTGRVRPSPDYLVAVGPTWARSPPTTTVPSTAGSVRLGRARLRPDRDPPAVVGAGQGGRRGRSNSRAADEDDDPGRARSVGGSRRPTSARQSRPKGVELGPVWRADHPFDLGQLDAPPRKTNRDRSAERAAAWESVPTRLATTLTGYIAQTRLSPRPSTMVRVEGVLREFACWLAVNAPEVGPSTSRTISMS